MLTSIETRARVPLRCDELALSSLPHRGSAHRHVQLPEMSAGRAAKNVIMWQAFLPADCISAMIKMGWDRTT